MTREEAIAELNVLHERLLNPKDCENGCYSWEDGWYVEAIDMAIEALQEVQKHEETFEWCTDCKEYDKDNYCCHRWSKMIRNTVEELKEYSGLVRCKDCKHYIVEGITTQYGWCHEYKHSVNEDDYCSYGERREP